MSILSLVYLPLVISSLSNKTKNVEFQQLVRMYLSEVVWPYRAGGHALELQKEEHEMLPG